MMGRSAPSMSSMTILRTTAIPSPHWRIFRSMNAQQLAGVLQELAEHVNLRRYKKHPRGPKKKPAQRTAYKNGGHVSTAKISIKKI